MNHALEQNVRNLEISESNAHDEERPYKPDVHLTMPENNLVLACPALASGKTFREHLDESYTQKHSGFGTELLVLESTCESTFARSWAEK